jgi:hypothetical protein
MNALHRAAIRASQKSIILLGCLLIAVSCAHALPQEKPPRADRPRKVFLARSRLLKINMTRKEVSSILGLDLLHADPILISAEGAWRIELYRVNDRLGVQLSFGFSGHVRAVSDLTVRGQDDPLEDKPSMVQFNLWFSELPLFPKLVSDGPLPKSIQALLGALGVTKHSHVKLDHATKEDVSQFIETMLSGIENFKGIGGLRVDRPILLSHPTETSFESSDDSALKIICLLSKRAKLDFAITENHTFVFEPIRNGCVEYKVEFVGYTGEQETFKVTKMR